MGRDQILVPPPLAALGLITCLKSNAVHDEKPKLPRFHRIPRSKYGHHLSPDDTVGLASVIIDSRSWNWGCQNMVSQRRTFLATTFCGKWNWLPIASEITVRATGRSVVQRPRPLWLAFTSLKVFDDAVV